MATADSGVRIFGEKRTINYARTLAFFEGRANVAEHNALTATMYQDANLADRRDHFEKETVLPHLNLRAADRVLDVGCGSGRWAKVIAPKVRAYLGIDFSPGLLEVARTLVESAEFQCVQANFLEFQQLKVQPPFTLVICSGILTYLNDSDVLRLFATVSQTSASESRVYIREPIAKAERLTLDGYWSEELRSNYSAVYRTRAEYLDLFSELSGFHVRHEGEPFSRELQNRAETEQRFFLLERPTL